MSATRILTGARWSSAVRCVAMAEHQALGTPAEANLPPYLESAFKRGVNVGKAWALDKREELIAAGHDVVLEAEVPWGLGWTGHVDLLDTTAKVAYETYHAAKGEFREVKALQIAGYCDELGDEWTAELAVIDTSEVDDDAGFAVQPYDVNPSGLRDQVRDIKRRVVAAVEDGHVDWADRVGDSPHHSECRSCPFAHSCWADWRPPSPDEVAGLEVEFDALRIIQDDIARKEADVASLKRQRDERRDAIRPYVKPGVPVVSGGTVVKVTEVAGRVSVKLGDFRKAGFALPAELEPFVTEGKPSERWKVDPS